jgi:hypothetical protein
MLDAMGVDAHASVNPATNSSTGSRDIWFGASSFGTGSTTQSTPAERQANAEKLTRIAAERAPQDGFAAGICLS